MGRSTPMLAISAAEVLATGRRSTRWFQGLSEGKIGQRRAAGGPCAQTIAGSTATRPRTRKGSRQELKRLVRGLWQLRRGPGDTVTIVDNSRRPLNSTGLVFDGIAAGAIEGKVPCRSGGAARTAGGLGHDQETFGGHAELRLLELPDVIAVDLHREEPIIERVGTEAGHLREGVNSTMPGDARALG